MNAVVSPPVARRLVNDRTEWNRFVAAAPNGHILQSWEWGEIKEQTGWEAIRLAITSGSDIVAGAQILLRNLPLGLGRLAYVPKGPILDWHDPFLRDEMLASLRQLAIDRDVISLKIEPEAIDGPLTGKIRALGLAPSTPVQLRSTILVDLTATEEDMLARQKQKTRYNIRLAGKKGVTVSEAGANELDEWYDMHAATAARDGFVIHSLDYYRLVLDVMRPRGMGTLLLARHDDDLLAGIVVFAFGQKAQYMYGASSNTKRNLMAPYLVQWEGMVWAKARGASIYDLWGIPDRLEEDEDLWGVYRHKRGYGGEIVRYVGAFDLVQSPLRHAALERVARPVFKQAAHLKAHGLRRVRQMAFRPVTNLVKRAGKPETK